MAYLLDTSILVRLANQSDAQHAVADAAIVELLLRNESLNITAQNLIEFRNVATRPKTVNGLGLSIAETESKSAVFETSFTMLKETSDIFQRWKALVGALGVIGKQVHDARLVAICHVNSISHVLTFNTAHFATLATHAPGVVVVDPANV